MSEAAGNTTYLAACVPLKWQLGLFSQAVTVCVMGMCRPWQALAADTWHKPPWNIRKQPRRVLSAEVSTTCW